MRFHHKQHLPHNFPRRQIALQSHQSGEAELAVYRTPHLARYANCVAPLLRHQHRFYGFLVFERQQVAAGAVHGFILRGNLWKAQG